MTTHHATHARTTPQHRRHGSRAERTLAGAGLALGFLTCSACSASTSATPAGTDSVAPAEFGLTPAQLAERIERTEQLIAACMTTAGFRYIALDATSVQAAMASDKSAPGLSSEEYVKQYGLGITTQPDKPIVTFGAGPDNALHLNGLPATDQVAYRRALWGEHPEHTHTLAIEEEDFADTGGCTRFAAEQVYTADQLSGTYVNPGDSRVAQDPRMIAATKKWADCMRAENFDYDQPGQVETDLRARLAAITKGQDIKSLTGPALDALKALQGEELAVASVLTTCEEKYIEPVQAKIETDLYGAPAP